MKPYKSNRLTNVIAKVEFHNKLTNMDSLPQDALKHIKERFPISEPGVSHQLNFHAKIANPSTINSEMNSERFTAYTYHSTDRKRSLMIDPLSLTVSYSKYDNYKEFQTDFIESIKRLFPNETQVGVRTITMRYINVFNDFDLNKKNKISKYINKKYLNASMLEIRNQNTYSRCISAIEHTYDIAKSKIQYGFYNPDYPSAIMQYPFLIDCTSYVDYLTEIKDVPDIFDKLHDIIENAFEDIITDETRNILI